MRGIDPLRSPSRKWVIIHGHFYQPPRENPWLNVIETQQSASPYHDWNERIYAECYRPNGYSRLLDPNGMITGIHNNYTLMSFNFGPTLMEWLERYHPVTARRIIEGDRISAERFDGHGNAVAQVYNHIIMPLASRRDQLTQIRWGKASFKRSFGRDPEGMWLAETAINMETVRCLIQEKIGFVILSPQQAESYRSLRTKSEWIHTSDSAIDTRRPYRLYARNSSGKKEGGFLDVFFFDEQLSKAASFGDLLQDAHTLGNRIDGCFTADAPDDEVAIIATDGETFGHHKPFGDMCIAYFFTNVAPALNIKPVNFGRYLTLHPPAYEVMLKDAFGEGSSWSCSHGVGRWRRDCGCQTGGESGWNQKWRAPMRQALDNLQEKIDEKFEEACAEYKLDPWELRDRYGSNFGSGAVKQPGLPTPERGPDSILTSEDARRLRRLLEAQKYMLFAFTSCGWFFADISGIEAMQNLAYACRALQLGIEPALQPAVMDAFMHDLASAQSNINGDTGAMLFERHIMPFFFHDRLISLTVAMKHALGVAQRTGRYLYGYQFTVQPAAGGHPQPSPPNERTGAVQRFRVSLSHEVTGEQGVWLVITDLANLKEPSGWVLPWDDTVDPASLSTKSLQHHPQAQLYTLADVFASLRQELATIYLEKIARHTEKRFAAWMQSNKSDLALLQSFYPVMPEYFRAPLVFIMQQQWDAVFKNINTPAMEDACIAELTALRRQFDHFKSTIDFIRSTLICEKLLTEELEKLTKHLNGDTCRRIRYLLTIVDDFSIPVSKHRLEDMFFPVLRGPVKSLYQEVISIEKEKNRKSEGNKKELLEELLSFARRMNFNTDDFPLP